MSAFLSLAPVSEAVFAALNVAAMHEVATGGAHQDTPATVLDDWLLFEVRESGQLGGFGTSPGQGQLPELGLRLHAFSRYGGFARCHAILAKAIELLWTPGALAVSGYAVCGEQPFFDDVTPLTDELVAGVKFKELVANLRLYVEQTS